MMQTAPSCRRAVLLFLAVTAAVSAVCSQAPLYYSNQNQYFLHGFALAGEGQLHDDWLANTLDPTPVFSSLVACTMRWLHPWAFHVYYSLLLGAYAAGMIGLFVFLAGAETARRRWPVFVALFLMVHAALLRWASHRWLGQDYPYYLQGGVAGQYILGGMLQPSAFGMLLVVAVCLFVRGRPFLAGAFVALTATVHSTYLLPGALLTLGFLTVLLAEKQVRQALALGAWTLALVLPVTVYAVATFRPTSPETFAEAQHILANIRIPHHTQPGLWFDDIAGAQAAWVVLALVLARRTRLFLVLAVPFVLAVLLTLAQVMTGSDTLALLFPWRISAVLVPIATTVVLSRLATLPARWLEGPIARGVSAAAVALLAAGGVWIMASRQGYATSGDELPVMDFVRRSRQPGDLYFLPVRVPKASTRGSLSSDFKPLPHKKEDARLIPLDLQRFRLYTGAPIVVDFKSIPYKDTDVIEWIMRMLSAQLVQEDIRNGRLQQALTPLRQRGITHLVVPAGAELLTSGLKRVYEDPRYHVYRVLDGE